MNKLLGSIIVASLLLVVASNVYASGPIEGCTLRHAIVVGDTSYAKGYNASSSVPNWGTLCLLDSVYNVTDWIFYGLLSLVSVFTVYGGFVMVTANGKP